MAPIIEVSENVLEVLNPKNYIRREDLEKQIVQTADLDRSNWVVIPNEFTNKKYKLIVDPARLSYNSAVEKAGTGLGLELQNNAKDSLRRKFIGSISWDELLKINLALGNTTPTMEEFVDYGRLLFLGMNSKIKIYNVAGKQIAEETLRRYFEDIYKVKDPWRAEWIDAGFKTKGKNLYVNSHHTLDSGGDLIPQNSEPLDRNTLMIDSRISLGDFLNKNHTKPGFPTKNVESGDLYYWYPRSGNDSVAEFDAGSDSTSFVCNRDPSYRSSYLGVRAVRHE